MCARCTTHSITNARRKLVDNCIEHWIITPFLLPSPSIFPPTKHPPNPLTQTAYAPTHIPQIQLPPTINVPTATGTPSIMPAALRIHPRCSSEIVSPSRRRCSIPGLVALSSVRRRPREGPEREGQCWALAMLDSSIFRDRGRRAGLES